MRPCPNDPRTPSFFRVKPKLFGVNEFIKKPVDRALGAQSLVPETCRCAAVFASLVEDSVRRAKSDLPLVPLCPVRNRALVLAIAGMVARVVDKTAL
jgi:hypothetical protein